jgi:parallel beta-helix repeat protein
MSKIKFGMGYNLEYISPFVGKNESGFDKTLVGIIAGCVVFFNGIGAAEATDYYVQSPLVASGATDPGTGTQDNPFRSFWNPMKYLQPGDTLHVLGGPYSSLLYLTVSGTATAPIKIEGDPTNLTQIAVTTGNAIQFKAGVSYISVSNFDVSATAVGGNGIFTEGSAPVSHIGFYHNRVHDCGAAGFGLIHTDYVTVMRNVVYNNAWLSPSDSSGIDLYQLTNVDQMLQHNHNYIADNIVYGNANKVPKVAGTPVTDGNGIIIDDARHTQGGYLATAPAYTAGTLIENNIVFNNGGRAIHVFSSDNVTIRNNTTFMNNTDPTTAVTSGEIEAMATGNVSIYNNILWALGNAQTGFEAQGSTNLYVDYNLVYNTATTTYLRRNTGEQWGVHNMLANPLFVNASTNPSIANFEIEAASPAIGAGKPGAGAAYDFNGVKRPSIAALGAYE